MNQSNNQQHKKLSLHPLKFDETISDLLKIKPEPKPPKKAKSKARKTARKRM